MFSRVLTICVVSVLSIASLKTVSLVSAEEPAHHNMHHGHDPSVATADATDNCTNPKIDLSRELALWDSSTGTLVPSGQNITFIPVIALEQRSSVPLHEEAAVSFLVEPERRVKHPEGSTLLGGLLAFYIPLGEGGRYRVSLNTRAWIDIIEGTHIDNQKIIPSVDYAMQHKCKTIVKSVEFELEEEKGYFLQLSSSIVSPVEAMISPVVE